MKRPHSAVAHQTLDLWAGLPRSAKVHTRIRWWTAPFEQLETRIPVSGRILEVGCGHGLFSTYLALSSPDRAVTGIDIDPAKIELAKKAVKTISETSLHFEHREAGDIPKPEAGWDAIVFVDVLYLMTPENRRSVLEQCAGALTPGGVLVVKEVDNRPRLKAFLAQTQEFVATKIIRITRGEHMVFPSAEELEVELAALGLQTSAHRLDRGYLHPHCVVTGTKPI